MKSQEQILRGRPWSPASPPGCKSETGPDADALRSETPRLRERLWLERIENTQIFRLGYVAPRPTVAAKVANIYAEEYLKLHFDTRQQVRERARAAAGIRAARPGGGRAELRPGAGDLCAGAWHFDGRERAEPDPGQAGDALDAAHGGRVRRVRGAVAPRLPQQGLGRAVPRDADHDGDFGSRGEAHDAGGGASVAAGDLRPELGRRGPEGQGDGAGPRAARAREVRRARAGQGTGAARHAHRRSQARAHRRRRPGSNSRWPTGWTPRRCSTT